MFLTTNRVSQFDEAILTRIHLMLRYDKLDQASQKFVNKVGKWRSAVAAPPPCARSAAVPLPCACS
jgi:hypothetical protein